MLGRALLLRARAARRRPLIPFFTGRIVCSERRPDLAEEIPWPQFQSGPEGTFTRQSPFPVGILASPERDIKCGMVDRICGGIAPDASSGPAVWTVDPDP
jgi:hypothetical protein